MTAACGAQAPGPSMIEAEDAAPTAQDRPSGTDATTSADVATATDAPRPTQDSTVSPQDAGPPRVDAGAMDVPRVTDVGMTMDVPRVTDTGAADTGAVDSGPRDTGTTVDSGGPSFPPGVCGEPVASTTTGPTVNEATINFNWSMACFDRRNNSLFVFVEDTDTRGTALRFYDYLAMGGPAGGDTVDLSTYRARARPFFVSTISGIALEPMWHYDRDYLAYAGTATFTELRRTNPIGTRLRVRFQNVQARQVATYTDGTCRDVPNGGRMIVRDLSLDMTVNDLCTDQDCIDWAGGCM